jgi:hypothetical protein
LTAQTRSRSPKDHFVTVDSGDRASLCITLMENNINHPNVDGHKIFADSLMALFPKSE